MKRIIYLGCDLLTAGTLLEFLGGASASDPVTATFVNHIGKRVGVHSLEYEDETLTIVLREPDE